MSNDDLHSYGSGAHFGDRDHHFGDRDHHFGDGDHHFGDGDHFYGNSDYGDRGHSYNWAHIDHAGLGDSYSEHINHHTINVDPWHDPFSAGHMAL